MERLRIQARSTIAAALLAVTMLCAALSARAAATQDTLEPVRTQLRLKHFTQAAELLKAQANPQNPAAEYLLGTLYRSGLGVPVDDQQARHWIESSAQHGNADAAYAMAALLANDAKPDSSAILQWLQRAAAAGHVMAKQALASGIQPQRFQPQLVLHDGAARRQAFWLAAAQDEVELLSALSDAELLKAQDEFGRTALFYAAKQGAASATALLLQQGAVVDPADAYGITPLMLAVGAGHQPVVTLLLNAGASLNSKDRVSNTVLMYAIGHNQVQVTQQLLAAGADIHGVNAQGWSALDWAVRTSNTELANQLRSLGLTTTHKATVTAGMPSIPLQHAAGDDLYRGWPDLLIAAGRSSPELFNNVLKASDNPARRGPNGETALLVAVQSGNSEAVEKLLMAGTPAVTAADNETPLSWALRHNQLTIVQLLLNKGLGPDAHGKLEDAPLLDAVRQNSEPMLNALLKAGAKQQISDSAGRTPLMLAAQLNYAALLRALLNAGASVDATDKHGRTALWLAAANGADDCVAALINAKANLDKSDNSKSSALMVAASQGYANVVARLLTAGASTQSTSNGNTALMLAAANGHAAVVKQLLSAGARTDAQNRFGDTALMFAARAGQVDVARALLAAGASSDLRNKDRASAKDIAERLGFKELSVLLERGA